MTKGFESIRDFIDHVGYTEDDIYYSIMHDGIHAEDIPNTDSPANTELFQLWQEAESIRGILFDLADAITYYPDD